MTPADLLACARDLIARPDAATVGVWPRTAALLARQALEAAVDAQWEQAGECAGLARATMRSQLICLPAYTDEPVARQIAFTYAALSCACHFHPYELAPTAAELSGWISDVEQLLTRPWGRLAAAQGSSGCQAGSRSCRASVAWPPRSWTQPVQLPPCRHMLSEHAQRPPHRKRCDTTAFSGGHSRHNRLLWRWKPAYCPPA